MDGTMGLDQSLKRNVSNDILEDFIIAGAALMVSTCHLTKPLDLGYKADDLMCSIC